MDDLLSHQKKKEEGIQPQAKKKHSRSFENISMDYIDPDSIHHELLDEVFKEDDMLSNTWKHSDCIRKESSPLELLVLGSMWYLGRGLTFNNIEEYTAISKETYRQIFHQFVEFGDKVKMYINFEFELCVIGANGKITTATFIGSWGIGNNGYLKWTTTMAPIKTSKDKLSKKWDEIVPSDYK
eukprot:6212153-Ditylum_brightwellii.AAC.1